jgi:glutamate-1-semialdehyde aminotransferase
MGKGQDLYKKARTFIPGGTQLLSKRPEMLLPETWPSYFSRAKGVDVWDLEGKRYTDMSYSAIGTCILGAGDPDVDAAVRRAIDNGVASTLNCPEEVELAELLCELHPWADMVRYARSGGEAMAVAIRIARAKTGRDRIAFCGYHGWHDWYLAANLAEEKALDGHLLPGLQPAGVPRGLQGTALPFKYNHIEELHAIIRQYGPETAAIIMEPIREHLPESSFMEDVREIATKNGSVLIFDEITAGFRLTTGGAHLLFSIDPDIAVFAKAMGNGYAISAVIGKKDVMEAAQHSFISSTNWTERIGPVAALATIRKHKRFNVAEHLIRIGKRVQDGWIAAARHAGLSIQVSGIEPLGHFTLHYDNAQVLRTLFTQLMLDRGYLATNAFYVTFAHQDEHVDAYLKAVEESFSLMVEVLASGNADSLLKGPVAHTGFKRLT